MFILINCMLTYNNCLFNLPEKALSYLKTLLVMIGLIYFVPLSKTKISEKSYFFQNNSRSQRFFFFCLLTVQDIVRNYVDMFTKLLPQWYAYHSLRKTAILECSRLLQRISNKHANHFCFFLTNKCDERSVVTNLSTNININVCANLLWTRKQTVKLKCWNHFCRKAEIICSSIL